MLNNLTVYFDIQFESLNVPQFNLVENPKDAYTVCINMCIRIEKEWYIMNRALLTLFLCLLSITGYAMANAQKEVRIRKSTTDQNYERRILEQDCQLIIAHINEYFAGIGALKSSGRIRIIKQEITQYLCSKGTPTAMAILREYEQRGWANM